MQIIICFALCVQCIFFQFRLAGIMIFVQSISKYNEKKKKKSIILH